MLMLWRNHRNTEMAALHDASEYTEDDEETREYYAELKASTSDSEEDEDVVVPLIANLVVKRREQEVEPYIFNHQPLGKTTPRLRLCHQPLIEGDVQRFRRSLNEWLVNVVSSRLL